MSETRDELIRTAREIIRAESVLGGAYLPARRNPLPEIDPLKAKSDALRQIDENEVTGCTRCALSAGRTNTVFGEGNPDADLVFVGEGPGADEDATGRPFVGRAGELLDRMISAMGLRRDDVFICNVVKCRPPGNRAPATEEADACRTYLVRQLQIIGPEVVVTLGNPATKNLLDTKVGITRLRGTWQKLPNIGEGLWGIDVMPTFHPAYVLRQYTEDVRGKVWSDLRQVMKRLGLRLPGKGRTHNAKRENRGR